MTVHRFWVPGENWSEGRVTLPAERCQQIRKVLRLGPGAEIEVFDGVGRCARAWLEREGAEGFSAGRLREVPHRGELRAPLVLLQALLKGDKNDFVVEKATELGAAGILFWPAQRSVTRLEADRLPSRLRRWRRIAVEAAEQCGRSFLPEVNCCPSLEQALREPGEKGLRVLLVYEGERLVPLREGLPGPLERQGTALVLGPEGGFDPLEVETSTSRGCRKVSLGSRILRAETAAVAALALAAEALEASAEPAHSGEAKGAEALLTNRSEARDASSRRCLRD